MHLLMHIHPLDRAATLPRIKHRPIDQLRRNIRKVRVRPHIRGIVPAQLQVHRQHTTGRRLANAQPAARGARERNEADLRQGDDLVQHVEGAAVDELEEGLRDAGLREERAEALADERGLGGGSEEDGVSGQEGGDDGADGDEVGVL